MQLCPCIYIYEVCPYTSYNRWDPVFSDSRQAISSSGPGNYHSGCWDCYLSLLMLQHFTAAPLHLTPPHVVSHVSEPATRMVTPTNTWREYSTYYSAAANPIVETHVITLLLISVVVTEVLVTVAFCDGNSNIDYRASNTISNNQVARLSNIRRYNLFHLPRPQGQTT